VNLRQHQLHFMASVFKHSLIIFALLFVKNIMQFANNCILKIEKLNVGIYYCHLHCNGCFPDEASLASSPQFLCSTCSGRQLFGISGRGFLWADVLPVVLVTSVKALMKPQTVAWPHPFLSTTGLQTEGVLLSYAGSVTPVSGIVWYLFC